VKPGKSEKAIGPARRAVTLDAEDAVTLQRWAVFVTFGRDTRRPFPSSRTALELNPSLALGHYGSARHWSSSGKLWEAVLISNRQFDLVRTNRTWAPFSRRIADPKILPGRLRRRRYFALKAARQPNFQWSRYACG